MGATIHVGEGVRDRFKLLARSGETDEELLELFLPALKKINSKFERGVAQRGQYGCTLNPS